MLRNREISIGCPKISEYTILFSTANEWHLEICSRKMSCNFKKRVLVRIHTLKKLFIKLRKTLNKQFSHLFIIKIPFVKICRN